MTYERKVPAKVKEQVKHAELDNINCSMDLLSDQWIYCQTV